MVLAHDKGYPHDRGEQKKLRKSALRSLSGYKGTSIIKKYACRNIRKSSLVRGNKSPNNQKYEPLHPGATWHASMARTIIITSL